MKRFFSLILSISILSLFAVSCQQDLFSDDNISPEVIKQLKDLGFNPDGIEKVEEGYRIENDIIITEEFLSSNPTMHQVPEVEHFHTNNLVSVSGSRVITVYIDAPGCSGNSTATGGNGNGNGNSSNSSTDPSSMRGGGNGNGGGGGGGTQFNQDYADALADAIGRYNSENLTISFQRVCDANQADITFSRLSKRDERRGVLGSAGFPTSSGDPYNRVNMSGVIISNFGWSVQALATVMAHELGHCVGFRHTDYYDRSISCGGSTSNEGDAGIGANHIPGTPNVGQVSASNKSFMLSCTGNENRPFNNNDQTALDYLY